MKKFIMVFALLVVALIVVGAFWHLNVQKEHSFYYYQKELAKRDKKIKELEDSIRVMSAKAEFFDEGIKWLRGASDEELERSIKLLRSVPYDDLLP